MGVSNYFHLTSQAGNLEFTLNSHGYTCFKEKENVWCVGGEDAQTGAERKV